MANTRFSNFLISRLFSRVLLGKHFPQAAFLLKQGADVDYKIKGRTLLWWCFKNRKIAESLFLIEKGANVFSLDTHENKKFADLRDLLHLAVEMESVELVEALVKKGVNANAKDYRGYSSIQIALSLYSTAQTNSLSHDSLKKIIECLIKQKVKLPDGYNNLLFLNVPMPKAGELELFDKRFNKFVDEKYFSNHSLPLHPDFDVAVIFVAESDDRLDSPHFGAVIKYFTPLSLKMYVAMANHFHLFRVVVSSITEMENQLIKLKRYLGPTQQIKHMMLLSHGNNNAMDFSEEKHHNLTEENVGKMKSVISLLAKDATIALGGCNTANGETNLAKSISASEISVERTVFGSSQSFNLVGIRILYPENKPVVFPFFKLLPDKANVRAYKKGEEIADGIWPIQSKL